MSTHGSSSDEVDLSEEIEINEVSEMAISMIGMFAILVGDYVMKYLRKQTMQDK